MDEAQAAHSGAAEAGNEYHCVVSCRHARGATPAAASRSSAAAQLREWSAQTGRALMPRSRPRFARRRVSCTACTQPIGQKGRGRDATSQGPRRPGGDRTRVPFQCSSRTFTAVFAKGLPAKPPVASSGNGQSTGEIYLQLPPVAVTAAGSAVVLPFCAIVMRGFNCVILVSTKVLRSNSHCASALYSTAHMPWHDLTY